MSQKRKAYIFDVDGTLANVDPILHHIINKDRNAPDFKDSFDAFHMDSVNVPANKEVVDFLWNSIEQNKSIDIIIVTAREEKWRAHTAYWLAKNLIPQEVLFMRPNNDNRTDYEVKKNILDQINLFWDVIHAVDDNPKIIKLWKENGIETTKIGDWDGEYR